MDKLTPQLTELQLKENIDALLKQGLQPAKVQEYVNNYSKGADGNYVLKGQTQITPSMVAPENIEQQETTLDEPQKKSLIQKISDVIGGFGAGAIKGGLSTLSNIGTPIVKQLNRAMPLLPEEQIGLPKSVTEPVGTAEKVGSFIEQASEYALPISKVSTAVKGLSFLPRLLAKSATAGAIGTAQSGELGKETAIAAGTEALLPVAGKFVAKPLFNVGKRLVKSLASGLSGVSSKAIESIVSEPNLSKQVAKNIDLSGSTETIKKNAETIINGVSKVRQQARNAYGQAIGALKAEDIKPKTFRDAISPIMQSFGIVQSGGKQIFKNVEFSEPKNLKTAQTLVNKLSSTKLDGYSLRKLLNEVDSSAYKIATTDERLSFNAFIRELSDGIKTAINQSTDKLKEINKAYSTDLQLTGAMEGILGKVKYKSLDELRKVSEKLDTLFSKKGLSPQIVDDFLNRIGVKPSEFKATEAVRQISDIGEKANTEGLSISEITRGLTSSIITPKSVRDLSILTGIAENNLTPVLEKLNPVARGAFIELLTQLNVE